MNLLSGMNSKMLFNNTKVDLQIVKYLFYMFVLTYGEPDLLTTIVDLLRSFL